MAIKFSDSSFANQIRTYYANSKELQKFPLIRMGRRSYAVNVNIETPLNNESNSILIGNYCSIGNNVKFIIDENHDYLSVSTYPWSVVMNWKMDWKLRVKGQIVIGNDVWIAQDVTILSGVTVGSGAVIGAGTVLAKDVPPYAIVVGNPAKVIKYRFQEEQIRKLMRIRWWEWRKKKYRNTRIY